MFLTDRLKHALSRFKTYKNWYAIIWPITRIKTVDRVLKTRLGPRVYVRNIFGPDFVVVHEMFCRDDYKIASIQYDCPEPVVLDIGANIGDFALLVHGLNPQAKIFAYEPEHFNLEVIKKNIGLNGAGQNIKIFPLAVAGTDGEKTFYVSQSEYAHTLEKNLRGNDLAQAITVNSTTIEQIFQENNINHIDLLKLDIEGAEYDVLYNLPQNLYDKIRYIALEIHDHPVHQKKSLIQFINEKGYAIKQSNKNPCVYLAKHN